MLGFSSFERPEPAKGKALDYPPCRASGRLPLRKAGSTLFAQCGVCNIQM
ncbi:hypothetical protein X755_08010 [Mesorhizobium sp. LNJC405B00]|nr:hypothetical protein X755_08010 [Mesorhizobium sp. LNJC405B00]